jgi:surfactin synthase thioesterase subunit
MMLCAVSALSQESVVTGRRRYLCLPPAGGTLTSLRTLADTAPPAAAWGVEYPGRGHRVAEPLPATLPDLADQLAGELVERFGPPAVARTVLVGFSMGSFVALELARRVWARSGVAPAALVVVGAVAPQRRAPGGRPHDYGALAQLAACPTEVWEYAVDLLRGDLRLACDYRVTDIRPAPCPIAALCGADDDAVDDATEGWRPWATGRFTSSVVPGGHLGLLDPGRGLEFWAWMRHVEEVLLDE